MSTDKVSIQLMSGPEDGLQKEFPLPRRGETRTVTIGRSEESDIALPYDGQVSRAHAELRFTLRDETLTGDDPESLLRVQLVDVGSRNGTYIEDNRLRGDAVDLKRGVLFRVGRTWLRVDN